MTRSGRIFIIIILLFNAIVLRSQDVASSAWVDSIFKTFSLDEKIGQLFIIRAHTDLGPEQINSVKSQIKKYHIGGLCFFQGTPQKQAEVTSEYQKLSKVPLIVSVDAEWGLGMRFKEKALSFPHQLMLGAVPDVDDIEEMGYAIGKQLKSLGVNVSFSPVADVNNNAANPVIGDRSFGEDKVEVAKRSIAYAKGLASAGILACGKHFPGHGDTDTDSHYDLPVITHSMERLRDVELYPFQQMIDAGIPAIMVAHLHVPAIDSTKNLSTTLSSKAINELLRKEMGFKGLVITDGLEMQGVAKHFNSGQVAVMSLEAGNDMLLLPEDIHLAFSTLKEAFSKGRLDIKMLDEKVKRILAVKYSLGLDSLALPNAAIAGKMAFDPYAKGVKHKLIEQAITVVQNKKALIPLVNLTEPKIATLSIGNPQQTPFQTRLNSYIKTNHYNLPKSLDGVDVQSLLVELRKYPRLIVSIHGL